MFYMVVKCISVRTCLAFLSTFVSSLALGSWFITAIQSGFGARVSNRTPDRHQKKNNTPTLGGVFILTILGINVMLWGNMSDKNVWLFIACIILFGLIGLYDDLKKIKIATGMSARSKILFQSVAATIIMSAWYWWVSPATEMCIPFFKTSIPSLGVGIIGWGVLVMVAVSNAVNLTDGLDGLAAGSLISTYACYGLICYGAGHHIYAQYLGIPYASSGELTVVAGSILGTLLGFLWYNAYPAQLFMGDVGSLSLGASLAFMALVCRQELLLLIAGGIFVIETLSVIIQVVSYKLRRKRVFRMAPLHHHFELLGLDETKITVRFWIVSIVLAIITLMILKAH